MTGATSVARSASGLGELVLRRRADDHLELRANGVFVMDTLEHSSERALATQALAGCGPGPLQVLVGGLGLGFTLAAVLADPRVGRCTVVEIEPALVDWMRDGTVPHGPDLVADPRVRLVVDDVASVLRRSAAAYDVVLLDVDNGPDHLVHDGNAALYDRAGLATARDALTPGGLLAVWSAAPAPALEAALAEVVGDVAAEELPVPGHGRVGTYHLYLARRPGPA